MSTIKIQKTKPNGLTKEEWGFNLTPYSTNLVYTSYFIYHRNSKREKWADEKTVLNYEDWCKKYKKEYDYYDLHYHGEYTKYLDKNNPILQKTRDGRTKLSGICAQIKNMPKCPPDIAKKAVLEFCIRLKVTYE